jgi:hypothetical protein
MLYLCWILGLAGLAETSEANASIALYGRRLTLRRTEKPKSQFPKLMARQDVEHVEAVIWFKSSVEATEIFKII